MSHCEGDEAVSQQLWGIRPIAVKGRKLNQLGAQSPSRSFWRADGGEAGIGWGESSC